MVIWSFVGSSQLQTINPNECLTQIYLKINVAKRQLSQSCVSVYIELIALWQSCLIVPSTDSTTCNQNQKIDLVLFRLTSFQKWIIIIGLNTYIVFNFFFRINGTFHHYIINCVSIIKCPILYVCLVSEP